MFTKILMPLGIVKVPGMDPSSLVAGCDGDVVILHTAGCKALDFMQNPGAGVRLTRTVLGFEAMSQERAWVVQYKDNVGTGMPQLGF